MHEANALEIDEALRRRIEELARARGLAPAELVREAVEEYAEGGNGKTSTIEPGDQDVNAWDIALEIGAGIPNEEWAKVPTDLSIHFDHYHYGHPKRED